MGTSSANPEKLDRYSTDGLEMLETLRSRANEVTEALETLRASSSRHVPDLGDAGRTLDDLVGDWHHLDEFAGDVAAGFRQAGGGRGVVTVSDADLARSGRVGFADRDQAVAAGEQAAQELHDLLRQPLDELDRERLDQLFADIARGQHDPAFAVTLSETIGVAGYVDAMALIRHTYTTSEGEYRVTDQGLGYAQLLGATLTTALDTVATDREDYQDPGNAGLAAGDRLSYDFVDELASGYQGNDYTNTGPYQGDPDDLVHVRADSLPVDLDRDLSVLLSYTETPAWVGVDIANNRLSPLLEDYVPDGLSGSEALVWGDRSGVVTNYATMLASNSDASTQWLYQDVYGLEHDNFELVLNRVTESDIDGGAALARVVENGLTNDDVHEAIPGAPSYVQGGLMREALMERAIDYTAELGEINNEHLNGAFAAGVDANMSVIDERINEPFRYDEGQRPEGVLEEYRNTHDFLRETVRDVDAAAEIRQTITDYGFDQTATLPGDPDQREAALRELGRIQGMVTEAEQNAGVGAAIDEQLAGSGVGPTPGATADYAIGFVPGLGTVNDIAGLMGIGAGDGIDWLVGELGEDYDSLSHAEQQAAAQRAEDRLNRAIWLSSGLYESDTEQGAALRESAQGEPFVAADGSIRPWDSMNDEQRQAYREWATEVVGNDVDQGPIYTEHGDIGTGVNDIGEGETDVSDRR